MAGETPIIIVAQAEGGDAALEQGVVVVDPAAGYTTEEVYVDDGEYPDVFPPFDFATFSDQVIWLAICFAVLYFAMSRLALPRIGGIIDARRLRIEGDLKEAERLRQETDRAVASYEAALAEARVDAGRIAEETRLSIRADIDGKRAATEADLSARMAEADARIQASKQAALSNVDAIAADAAQAVVARLGGSASEADAQSAVLEAKGAV